MCWSTIEGQHPSADKSKPLWDLIIVIDNRLGLFCYTHPPRTYGMVWRGCNHMTIDIASFGGVSLFRLYSAVFVPSIFSCLSEEFPLSSPDGLLLLSIINGRGSIGKIYTTSIYLQTPQKLNWIELFVRSLAPSRMRHITRQEKLAGAPRKWIEDYGKKQQLSIENRRHIDNTVTAGIKWSWRGIGENIRRISSSHKQPNLPPYTPTSRCFLKVPRGRR